MVEQKCWWGPFQTLSASTKRSVEQKCGTKTAEEKLVGTLEDPKCKYKKVSGTKIGSTNLVPIFVSVFVPLTFLHLHLGFPSPNVQGSLPIFIPL